MREYLKYLIIIIFNPVYWTMNRKYDSNWDKELSNLMNSNNFVKLSDCSAMLGSVEIWIQNHPYESFVPYQSFSSLAAFGSRGKLVCKYTGRASRRTIIKAKSKLKLDLMSFEDIRDYKIKEILK